MILRLFLFLSYLCLYSIILSNHLTEKAPSTDAIYLPLMRGGGLHFHVMLCGRGLRTTHIHRPLTTYFLGVKISLFLLSSKLLGSFLQIFHSKDFIYKLFLYFCNKYLPIVVNDASYGLVSERRVAVRFSRVKQ